MSALVFSLEALVSAPWFRVCHCLQCSSIGHKDSAARSTTPVGLRAHYASSPTGQARKAQASAQASWLPSALGLRRWTTAGACSPCLCQRSPATLTGLVGCLDTLAALLSPYFALQVAHLAHSATRRLQQPPALRKQKSPLDSCFCDNVF